MFLSLSHTHTLSTVPVRALFEACEHGHVQVVEILLSASTLRQDQNILAQTDCKGRNCMMMALENGHEDIAEALINDDEWRY